MAQSNRIDVEVLAAGEAGAEHGLMPFSDVHYISFVNNDSFGIPAVLTEPRVKAEGLPVRVLYVNPTNVAAMVATRRA